MWAQHAVDGSAARANPGRLGRRRAGRYTGGREGAVAAMTELPTGTLTLLFTDIEDSTPLTLRLGAQYPAVLEAHRALVRAAVAAHDGREVGTEGDSFFVVFARPTAAVAAAVQAQRDLAAAPWPAGGGPPVRMGLHTGEPVRTPDGYTGLDVVRGARIRDAGHGGQVLLSTATAALVEHALPGEWQLRDLGAYRLKGLPRPERIVQLVAPGLPDAFPPLRSLDARRARRRDAAPDRPLVAVLVTDVVGSTARLVAEGDRAWRDLRERYVARARAELERAGGEEIAFVGDGVIAIFDRPADAVRCACALRAAGRELGLAQQIAVHAGEVDYAGGDIGGLAVHAAVRIADLAGPDEVVVSGTVRDLMAGSGVAFAPRGVHPLRGLPGEWPLFAPDCADPA